MNFKVKLAHGNRGEESSELVSEIFYSAFENSMLSQQEDATPLDGHNLVMSTDSFTVTPLFFSGGDIGKLSICGTCNDIAMMGAKPKYLTCSVIIEEGFEISELKKIVESMQSELACNGAKIVAGDTKVVPRGSVDKIFINTTGVGEIIKQGMSANNLQEGDVILLSRDIGAHGATLFCQREGIELSSSIQSDCASLFPSVEKLINENIEIVAMRDATRGGVAGVLNEWARQSNVCIKIQENAIKIEDEVMGVCELLGFDALSLANEGTFVLAVKKEYALKSLELLKGFHSNASVIGEVTLKERGKVILNSEWGSSRYLDMPYGELLPRIC